MDNLEGMRLCEVIQTGKGRYRTASSMYELKKKIKKILAQRNRSRWLPEAGGNGERLLQGINFML